MNYSEKYISEIASLVNFINENNSAKTIEKLEAITAIEDAAEDFYSAKAVREAFELGITEQVALY